MDREREREESCCKKRSRARGRKKGSAGLSGLDHTMQLYYVSTHFSSVSTPDSAARSRAVCASVKKLSPCTACKFVDA